MRAVDEIIGRMLQAINATNAAEMSRVSGFSSGLVSTWKKRGAVPDGALAKISQISGARIQWLKTGEGEMFSKVGGQTPALDRELMIESIITIGMAEKEIGVTLKPEKRAELVMMIYDEYYAGEDVKPAKVIQLVKLAA